MGSIQLGYFFSAMVPFFFLPSRPGCARKRPLFRYRVRDMQPNAERLKVRPHSMTVSTAPVGSSRVVVVIAFWRTSSSWSPSHRLDAAETAPHFMSQQCWNIEATYLVQLGGMPCLFHLDCRYRSRGPWSLVAIGLFSVCISAYLRNP